LTFDVGSASAYAPVNVAFASVTTAGTLTASTTGSDHPNLGTSRLDVTKTANRYWTVTNTGVVFTTYSATLNFVSGDLDAGATASNFNVQKYSGSAWTTPTVGTRTATS